MAANIVTTGFVGVDNMLKTLKPNLQKKAIKKGTRAGAALVLKRARAFVPRGETLVLAKTLTVRLARRDKGQKLSKDVMGHGVSHLEKKSVTAATQALGLKGKKKARYAGDPFYAQWLEWGAYSRPGMGYLRRALYSSKQGVLAESRRAMTAGVNEIARKAKK